MMGLDAFTTVLIYNYSVVINTDYSNGLLEYVL